MMMSRSNLLTSLYIAGAVVVLALTGVFGAFQQLSVITLGESSLTLSMILMGVALGGTAYIVVSRVQGQGVVAMLVNAVASALVVAGILALLTLLVYQPDRSFRAGIAFIFPNLSAGMFDLLTFGQSFFPGLLILLGFAAVMGLLVVGLFLLPKSARRIVMVALSVTTVLGLMQGQLREIVTLPDVAMLLTAFGLAYAMQGMLARLGFWVQAAVGAIVGLAVGIAAVFLAGSVPDAAAGVVFGLEPLALYLPLIGAAFGLLGVFTAFSNDRISGGVIYVVASLLILAMMNWQGGMTWLAGLVTFGLLLGAGWLVPILSGRAESQHNQLARSQQAVTHQAMLVMLLVVLMFAPTFLGSSLTFALSLVGLYIIMGIGLNIVVGYAGLLDLGHVGFFAIGAYTIGLLTAPTILTCGAPIHDIQNLPADRFVESFAVEGAITTETVYFLPGEDGAPPTVLTCRIWNFWAALPMAVFMAGAAGIILGIPVLRLRGDYLAIVTLGLSEIISILIAASDFKFIFGSAQGISPIPSPVLDLSWLRDGWQFEFFSANIYYLVVPAIFIGVFVSNRLVNSRVGRAWRSMRSDEDVAEAMGIDLVRSKLSAFGISAAFAGLGGAFFGAGLQGTFPNSFTLLVSINVLSMIIIGGLGSTPGIMLGALMLVGLPEILRELDDYRLLVFGMLLIGTMLLKPEGLIPPPVRRLSEEVREQRAQAQAAGD